MPELVVIAPEEMVLPLRLAGVAVLAARNPAEAGEHIRDLRGRTEVEWVLLPEHLLPELDRQAYREVLDGDHPCFIPLPMDWQETRDARRDFELRLGRVLGCRIHLGARLRQPDAPRPGLSPGEAAGPGKPEDEGLTAGGAREKGGPR